MALWTHELIPVLRNAVVGTVGAGTVGSLQVQYLASGLGVFGITIGDRLRLFNYCNSYVWFFYVILFLIM